MTARANRRGFTLVELIVVMAITMFVLVAASRVMISMVSQFKTQSKIAETSLESNFGLELMRRDLSSAGYSLPYGIANGTSDRIYQNFDWTPLSDYAEIVSGAPNCPQCPKAVTFNDATAGSKSPPRPVLVGNPAGTLNGSDYFVIKSLRVGDDYAAGKFHLLSDTNAKNKWYKTNTQEDKHATQAFKDISLRDTDWVIVLSMRDTSITGLGLVRDGSDFTTQFDNTFNYRPPSDDETRIIMGITDSDAKPRAPFNRADYYISKTVEVPSKCAPGTGVLVKAVMQHSNGALGSEVPIVDCVADFQVIFGIDTNNDGYAETHTDSLAGKSASQIRKEVKEVNIYILTHEGQMDPKYDFSQSSTPASSKIRVGDYGLGREFDFTTSFDNPTAVGTRWKWYRWRVLRISEKPTAIK